MSLQPGLDALNQGRYQEAVQALEQFCRSCADSRSKEYIQALMGLVKAYPHVEQGEKAIALCRRLVSYEHPQVSNWAQQALKSLEANQASVPQPEAGTAENAQSAEKLTKLLQAGQAALKQRLYTEAIQSLEAFCGR